jgi:hypothetical protein
MAVEYRINAGVALSRCQGSPCSSSQERRVGRVQTRRRLRPQPRNTALRFALTVMEPARRMSKQVSVAKDLDKQRPVPSAWRRTLSAIVEAIRENDFQLARRIADVPTLPEKTAKAIEGNIKGYGARLVSLPEEAWTTSACQWMGSYWDLLVDLFTEKEGASDLVLSVRVRESSVGYSFEVLSVHVP